MPDMAGWPCTAVCESTTTDTGLHSCTVSPSHPVQSDPASWCEIEASLHLEEFTFPVYTEIMVIRRVEITRRAAKQLRKLPRHIVNNLIIWVTAVEHDGLDEVRKVPGYHDEPLKGARFGQRSIRLSHAYRAIYEIKGDTARFASVAEVSKHDY